MKKQISLFSVLFVTLFAYGSPADQSGSQPTPAVQSSNREFVLVPSQTLGSLKKTEGQPHLENADGYIAYAVGDGLSYRFEEGALTNFNYLTTDMLLDGTELALFTIALQEGEGGRVFKVRFGLVNQCSARVRFPLASVDMNLSRLDREAAWLKPKFFGDRVDLSRVDRMTFTLTKKAAERPHWYMTPISAQKEAISAMTKPVLPKGKLLDELGQYTLTDWPGKSVSVEEVTARIRKQYEDAPKQKWPEHFSRWGGWKELQFEATGFFHKTFAHDRWWLVDPDGYAFWSTGIDCVRPSIIANIIGLEEALTFVPDRNGEFAGIYSGGNSGSAYLGSTGNLLGISYLGANLIRAFGPETWQDQWAEIALSQLRGLAANTVGNWSRYEYASKAGFPYVYPLTFIPQKVRCVFRDFPDIFDPAFAEDANQYAMGLEKVAKDPALIGYFMMNEPKWGFTTELPAAGMLYVTPACHTRTALSSFLKERYSSDDALAAAWELPATFENIRTGLWTVPLTESALSDLADFSEIMVDRYFTTLSQACRKVAPNHLNLGIRYAGVPPQWAVKGMRSFDIFSINSYTKKIPADTISKIHDVLHMPVIIGEWHFGALDAGLPAAGVRRVASQADRGKAYSVYIEDAAANPYCVGTHWYKFYDQSALGRFDGENYNIGFFDICNKPHEPLCESAKRSHSNIYNIAAGQQAPTEDAPQYIESVSL